MDSALIVGGGTLFIALLTFYGGWVMRSTKGESTAAAAAEIAKDAKATAERAAADLAAFKTQVASDYASNLQLDKMEGRVVDAINRLGDRLDRVFERDENPPPRAPRARNTKG